jgi:ubiquinone biosynthesis protein
VAVLNLVSSVRGITTAIKDVARLREIAGVLARHGFGEAVQRLGINETIGLRSLVPATSVDNAAIPTARRIRMAIEDLGPTFVKLGQILSTRPDLVPADLIAELQHLQDDVPALPFELIRAQIEAELGGPLDQFFASVDEKPLASASIAQVHRAVLLHETEEVVLKVQRPAIARRIDADLNILHFMARQVEQRLPDLALMDPVGIVDEFERAIQRELDFGQERRNIARFQQNFKDFPGVRAPRVFDAVSTTRVLTMEYAEGVKITLAAERFGLDPYELAPRMLRALLKMVFQDGYFHGDLHPGNVLIQPSGGIVLIDFGLVGRLTPRQREHILDLLIGLTRQDWSLVARTFFDLGIKVPGVIYDFEAFEADVVDVMERHLSGRTLSEINVGGYFSDLVDGAIRHQIKMPPTYTMVFKALMTVEGIGKTLAPDINLVDEAAPFVLELAAERYSPNRLMKEAIDGLDGLGRFLRAFPQQANHLLRDLSEGRLSIRVEAKGVDDAIMAARSIGRRRNRALVACACIVAGSLALGHGGATLLGIPTVSFLLYAAGALLGLGALGTSWRD